jgi:hypothetical protein
MYAQLLGGTGKIPSMPLQHLDDVTLLELFPSIREEHALFDHLGNEGVQRLPHEFPSPKIRPEPEPNRNGCGLTPQKSELRKDDLKPLCLYSAGFCSSAVSLITDLACP